MGWQIVIFSHRRSGWENQIESERAFLTLVQLVQIFSPCLWRHVTDGHLKHSVKLKRLSQSFLTLATFWCTNSSPLYKWTHERSYIWTTEKDTTDHRSSTHNLSNCEIKAWKKKKYSSPWPLGYHCSEKQRGDSEGELKTTSKWFWVMRRYRWWSWWQVESAFSISTYKGTSPSTHHLHFIFNTSSLWSSK